MQTEMMLRLLRKDPTSKSGYKIVGTMLIEPSLFGTGHSYRKPDSSFWVCNQCDDECGIEYDAFDLGFKHGDEWWFVGDKVKDRYYDDNKRIKRFGVIQFSTLDYNMLPSFNIDGLFELESDGFIKRIGNIHEEEK